MRTSASPKAVPGSPEAWMMKANIAGMCDGPQFCNNPRGTGAADDILPTTCGH